MKRLLSVFLAMVMIAGFVPTVHGAIATGGESMSFVFGAAAYNSETEITNADLDTVDDDGSHSFNRGGGSSPWKVDGMRYIKNMYAKPQGDAKGNCLYWQVYKTRMDGNGVIVIHLDVEETGKFVPSLTYQSLTNGYQNDVYLIPAHKISDELESKFTFYDANGKLNGNSNVVTFLNELTDEKRAEYKLGTVQMRNSLSEKVVHTFDSYGEYEIDRAGSYYLILQANDTLGTSGSYYGQMYSFDLTPVATESIVLDSEFDYKEESYTGGLSSVRAFAVYGTDGEITETDMIVTPSVVYGQTCTVSAPIPSSDYKFLYWARGATMDRKQIVSYNAEFEFLPSEGVNYLLAVYEKKSFETSDKQEFYNANGQLLPELEITNGVMPKYPSMAGFGKARAWALRNEDGSYTEYYENGDAPETDGAGTLVFMAVYNDPEPDITVTIDGVTKKYKYGDEVECTPSLPENRVFLYWLRDGEIVSLERDYSFNVWEDCTLETVYGYVEPTLSKTMRKIILDKFTAGESNALMAEFIGFEDALEKGIMYDNRKIAMTSPKTQFTIIDDAYSAGEATGYAIVRDSSGNLIEITDQRVIVGKTDEEILAERRDIAEQNMRESVSVLWTPSETIEYHVGSESGGFDATLVAGRIYRGLPYVYNAGSPDAFLQYAGETDANGVYTISNLNSAAMTGGQGTTRIGNDCSGAIVRAWSKMGASVQAKATKYMSEKNGFIKVGDYESQYDDYTGGTIAIATANGEQKMYEAYSELQKADAVVHWNGSGHSLMIVDVDVVYSDDGSIDGDNSSVTVLEQTKRFFTSESSFADTKLGTVYRIGGVDVKHSFSKLYNTGYLPITCRELSDASYINKPSVNDSINTPNINNIFEGTITSNWAIDTVTLDITGNGVSQSATASIARANIFSFDMAQFELDKTNGMLYGSYDIEGLSSGTYTCKVTVKLADGTVFTVRNFNFTV